MKFDFDFESFKKGIMSIFTRNALLMILVNTANTYGMNMKNGVRGQIGMNTVGVSGAVLGTISSLYMISALFMRAPAGGLVDKKRERVKLILTISLIAQGISYLLFGFVKTQATLTALYIYDGFCWSFNYIVLPAMVMASVDRKAMGSAYALIQLASSWICAGAASKAISIYQQSGALRVALTMACVQIIPVVLIQFLDNKKVVEKMEQEAGKKAHAQEKPSDFNGYLAQLISFTALPLGLAMCLSTVGGNTYSNYLPTLCQAEGFTEYLKTMKTAQRILGFINAGVGFLCDLVNPLFFSFASFVINSLGLIMMGKATTDAAMSSAVMMFTLGRFYSAPMRIAAAKLCGREEQGRAFGTLMVCCDIMTIISQPIVGIFADKVGIAKTISGTGFVQMIAPVIIALVWIFVWIPAMKKKKEETPSIE